MCYEIGVWYKYIPFALLLCERKACAWFYNQFHLCNIAETLDICYIPSQSSMPHRTRLPNKLFKYSSVHLHFVFGWANVTFEYAGTYKLYHNENMELIFFLKRYHNSNISTGIILAVRKCCLWLTCLLGMNIDVLDKANLNDFQQWLSFKFELPTLWSNGFDYSYLKIYSAYLFVIHHDFSTGTGGIEWLHTDLRFWWNYDSSTTQAETQESTNW